MRVLFIVFLGICQNGLAQYVKEEQITLSGTFRNPLEIEAINKGEEIDFFCLNKSWFPYQVEIIFRGVQNLNGPRSQKNIVLPGRQRLLSQRIQDPNVPHAYEYSIQFMLGNPNTVADVNFPYLIPCKPGKAIKINKQVPDQILLTDGDTITAMRRGIVTSTPQSDREADRLFKNTIEILHDDGTVGTYQIPTRTKSLVKEGEKIFPGQPIARISGDGMVKPSVYILLGQGKARSFDYKVALSENETVNHSAIRNITVIHPPSVVERELSKKELKKYRSNSLYP